MSAEETAQAHGREVFTRLVEPHRAELRAHCYRMLGSLQDADDAVQETLLAAWLGFDGFEGRSSVRTWLYRIATNRCLNLLRAASRRPRAAMPAAGPVTPSRAGEVPWLQPFPDSLLDGVPDHAPGPEARYESREAISLAFVTAVQVLPPTQRAVLLLRDVLGYRAAETAGLLGVTEDSVAGALRRARASMPVPDRSAAPAVAPTTEEKELLDRFVEAFTRLDVHALVALMTDDVWVRMPPQPAEYVGREAARRFFASIDEERHRIARMVPVRANGHPAWGEYLADPVTGGLHLVGILVVAFTAGGIGEVTRFETAVAPYFGLPRIL
jgi:RNA polymerase sigma-70 factor (ECF subfamily)